MFGLFYFLLLATVHCLKVSFKIPGQEVLTLKSPEELKEEIAFSRATLSFKEIPEFATEILVQIGDKTFAVKDEKLEIKSSEFVDTEKAKIVIFVSSRSSGEILSYSPGIVNLLQTAKSNTQTEHFYGKLPEITHIFQKPRPKDSLFRSLIFTVILGALWIPLISFLKANGVNLSNLYVNSNVSGWGKIFLCSLVANVASLWLYWTMLNIFQFLGLASVVGLITIVSGRNALKARYDWRSQ